MLFENHLEDTRKSKFCVLSTNCFEYSFLSIYVKLWQTKAEHYGNYLFNLICIYSYNVTMASTQCCNISLKIFILRNSALEREREIEERERERERREEKREREKREREMRLIGTRERAKALLLQRELSASCSLPPALRLFCERIEIEKGF